MVKFVALVAFVAVMLIGQCIIGNSNTQSEPKIQNGIEVNVGEEICVITIRE